MSNTKVELLCTQLERARTMTLSAAAKVPESHRFRQARAGGATPLWLVGHLANTLNAVALVYSFQEKSRVDRATAMTFAPDFAGGRAPTTNAQDYPAWDEVVALYDTLSEAVIATLRTRSDDDLEAPLSERAPEQLRKVFPTVGDAMIQMVNHDAYHRGQLALLAKAE